MTCSSGFAWVRAQSKELEDFEVSALGLEGVTCEAVRSLLLLSVIFGV